MPMPKMTDLKNIASKVGADNLLKAGEELRKNLLSIDESLNLTRQCVNDNFTDLNGFMKQIVDCYKDIDVRVGKIEAAITRIEGLQKPGGGPIKE